MIDTASLSVEKSYDIGSIIRAIDVKERKALIGLGSGTVYELDLDSGEKVIR